MRPTRAADFSGRESRKQSSGRLHSERPETRVGIFVTISETARWRTSSRCEAGKCVELTTTAVRNSTNPRQILDMPAAAIRGLVEFACGVLTARSVPRRG
ncbi:DUF397 domain-containing protein [Actinokineospora inagensis]|uniref:DUF397 domain-containing protein n=1 Tax=Actinokineospora inagensis TaxID=103730 RepID=UPI000A057632